MRTSRYWQVKSSHIAAAIERELGIDPNQGVAEQIAKLEKPMRISREVYEAARAEMSSSPDYDELIELQLPEPLVASHQESDDFETVYALAARAQPVLERQCAGAWQPSPNHEATKNFKVPKDDTKEKWVDYALSPGIKGRERAEEKMANDYDGHAKELKDLSRITLIYEQCARMVAAVRHEVSSSGAVRIVSLKNRFRHPTSLGYSDLNATIEVELQDDEVGHPIRYLAELQLSHPAMIKAKEKAHAEYKIIREELPKLCQGALQNMFSDTKSLEEFLIDRVAKSTDEVVPVPASSGMMSEANRRACESHVASQMQGNILGNLDKSALDFATEMILSKVESIDDTLALSAQLELQGGKLDLDAFAKLEIMPDKMAAMERKREQHAIELNRRQGAIKAASEQHTTRASERRTSIADISLLLNQELQGSFDVLQGAGQEEAHAIRVALEELGKHKYASMAIAQCAEAVVAQLSNPEPEVAKAALKAISKLPPMECESHAGAVVAQLDSSNLDPDVGKEVVKFLSKLEPDAIAEHAHAIAAQLDGPNLDPDMGKGMLKCLSKLEPAVLAEHASTIIRNLGGTVAVSRQTFKCLSRLPPEGLTGYVHALATQLKGAEDSVCKVIIECLLRVDPATDLAVCDAAHAASLMNLLKRPATMALAAELLGKLPGELLEKAGCIQECLDKIYAIDKDKRKGAFMMVSKIIDINMFDKYAAIFVDPGIRDVSKEVRQIAHAALERLSAATIEHVHASNLVTILENDVSAETQAISCAILQVIKRSRLTELFGKKVAARVYDK